MPAIVCACITWSKDIVPIKIKGISVLKWLSLVMEMPAHLLSLLSWASADLSRAPPMHLLLHTRSLHKDSFFKSFTTPFSQRSSGVKGANCQRGTAEHKLWNVSFETNCIDLKRSDTCQSAGGYGRSCGPLRLAAFVSGL